MAVIFALSGLYAITTKLGQRIDNVHVGLGQRIDNVELKLSKHKRDSINTGALALESTGWYSVDKCNDQANIHYVKIKHTNKFFALSVAHLNCGGLLPNHAMVCPNLDLAIYPSCPGGQTSHRAAPKVPAIGNRNGGTANAEAGTVTRRANASGVASRSHGASPSHRVTIQEQWKSTTP